MESSAEPQIEHLAINGVSSDDIVNPWNVTSSSQTGVDYDKLISMYHI